VSSKLAGKTHRLGKSTHLAARTGKETLRSQVYFADYNPMALKREPRITFTDLKLTIFKRIDYRLHPGSVATKGNH